MMPEQAKRCAEILERIKKLDDMITKYESILSDSSLIRFNLSFSAKTKNGYWRDYISLPFTSEEGVSRLRSMLLAFKIEKRKLLSELEEL